MPEFLAGEKCVVVAMACCARFDSNSGELRRCRATRDLDLIQIGGHEMADTSHQSSAHTLPSVPSTASDIAPSKSPSCPPNNPSR